MTQVSCSEEREQCHRRRSQITRSNMSILQKSRANPHQEKKIIWKPDSFPLITESMLTSLFDLENGTKTNINSKYILIFIQSFHKVTSNITQDTVSYFHMKSISQLEITATSLAQH